MVTSAPLGITGVQTDADTSGRPLATPPVAMTSNSTGPGLSGLALTSDDFSRYTSTADLLNNISTNSGGTGGSQSLYGDGANGNLIELDKTVLYNGHPTMKYNQPGGVADTPNLHVMFSPQAHIWYRVKVRFSPGFTTTGTLTNSANAYKLLSWGWLGGYEGSGRLEITNTTQYQLYEGAKPAQGSTTPASSYSNTNWVIGGNITTEWTDGGWYDYIIEVDHSQPVGMIRLWRAKDGQPPIFRGEASEQMQDGTLMPAVSTVSIGLNFNQIRRPDQNQALWWGQWEVVDGTQHPNPFGVSR